MGGRLVAGSLALGALLAVAAAPVAAGANLDGWSGPRAARSVDLAGTWRFQPKGRARMTIRVPGGGWYKQGFHDVAEATYTRRIRVPRVMPGQVTILRLGAVNHQATVYVDGHRAATHTTSFTPQSFDLTRFAKPGHSYTLHIAVKGRAALVSRPGGPPGSGIGHTGPRYLVPDAADWCESIPQGIFRSARLELYPAMRIADAFVKTSVRRRALAYDVRLANASARKRTVTLRGRLRSWNGRRWRYPRIPARRFRVRAHSTRTVTIGPLHWRAGRTSYWWPNVPYRHGYRAQLHVLRLSLAAGRLRSRAAYRFGFREMRQVGTHYELNGIRVNLRGDSLQGAMYDRIDHAGKGDAYDTYPGFLPASRSNPGWPRALDNYQRLNYSAIRVHQEPASPYMLDTADAMGQMLIGESAIRGSEDAQDFQKGRANMVRHLRDLVRRDRNHPSIVRWSQANEPDASGSDSLGFEQALYRTVMASDGTRPVSIDVTSETYDAMRYANFSVFQHYVNDDGSIATGYTDDVHPRRDRPFGRGEFIWPQDTSREGFTWFATATEKMREKDASDIRPYALAGAWASVIPGVRSSDFITDNYAFHPLYGEDNLRRPWANPQIRRVQRAFNPLLVADRDYWERNKQSDKLGSWPTVTGVPVLRPGDRVVRKLAVFNDTLAGNRVDLGWQARVGSPRGRVAASGRQLLRVARGSRTLRSIRFTAPASGGRLYLVLSASKPGRGRVFFDDGEYFRLAAP
jgi:hypothetical protein